MIGLWGLIIGIVAALLAALFATADSALLAFHASEAAASEAAFAQRERRHRSLSMARVLAYIAAGAAFAKPLQLSLLPIVPRAIAAAAAAILICVLAEGLGRAIGYSRAVVAHARLMFVISGVDTLLRPAVAFGGAIERALHAIMPPTPANADERETSAEQFLEVVTAEADVSSAEEALIHGVFSMGDTEVQEIMLPRVDIVGIEAESPWSELLDRIRSSEHARFPVYRETLDDVIGILYAKDVLPAIVADQEPAAGWLSLMRPPSFIPISKRIDEQLRVFQASRTHIAIVSDEYGGTAGLVTIEDILEEIVGEIRDEYDVEEPEITQEGNTRFWVAGRVSLEELCERLDVDLAVENVTTVGGLVYDLFGRVPRAGESLTHAGFRIVVERVRGRRIERVYFERLEPAHGPGSRASHEATHG